MKDAATFQEQLDSTRASMQTQHDEERAKKEAQRTAVYLYALPLLFKQLVSSEESFDSTTYRYFRMKFDFNLISRCM